MKNLPNRVIERLTLYHCILNDMAKSGEAHTITSAQIASLLKIDDSQVRKDISMLEKSGKSRVGYDVSELKKSIENTLGFQKPKDTFVVGAGNLGTALSKYDNFTNYGLNVKALFDNNPLKIGIVLNDIEVYNINQLPDLAKKMGVEIAILTVPRKFAQSTANLLIEAKIKYIWNFSTKILNVPPDIQVWNENLMGNFLQFAYKIGK